MKEEDEEEISVSWKYRGMRPWTGWHASSYWAPSEIVKRAACIEGNISFGGVAAMHLHYGDMTDSTCLVKIVKEIQPTEVYNLAAQSHVKVSLWLLARLSTCICHEVILCVWVSNSNITLVWTDVKRKHWLKHWLWWHHGYFTCLVNCQGGSACQGEYVGAKLLLLFFMESDNYVQWNIIPSKDDTWPCGQVTLNWRSRS